MRQATDDPYARQRAEVKRLLRHDPDLASNHVALVSLIGSQAYGMATPDSDSDYRGVYVADPEILLGLDRPQPQFERKDPDITVFELGKFCELAMAANPNILEVLWGPDASPISTWPHAVSQAPPVRHPAGSPELCRLRHEPAEADRAL